MNYTPNDLEKLELKRSIVGGVNEEAVNEVINNVIEDYSAYIRESLELKDKLALASEALKNYKNMEESLQNTLLVAQKTSDDIKKNAYQKAENIIKEAEIKAQKMIQEANQEVLKIKYEYEELKKKMYVFKTKSEALIMSQLEILKDFFDDQEE